MMVLDEDEPKHASKIEPLRVKRLTIPNPAIINIYIDN